VIYDLYGDHNPMTGPKNLPTAHVPKRWITKQRGQDRQRDWHDDRVQRWRDHLESLDRRQHRDRRGDHAVAVEKCRAEDPQRDQHDLRRATRQARTLNNAISAMIPPSPSLSARMMNVTYLIETMIVTARNTSDNTP
jgi:hypothetical protein